MQQLSQGQTIRGVGRLHCGHRTLGCAGYTLQTLNDTMTVVHFDPMPDAALGDVFHLTLEDGRILECQILTEYPTYCTVLDGPRVERRRRRRPAPMTRARL